MTDLVARLRASVRYEAYDGDGHERRICGRQMSEAADEIERLRVLLAEMRADRDAAELSRDAAHAEYERLRARLDLALDALAQCEDYIAENPPANGYGLLDRDRDRYTRQPLLADARAVLAACERKP